MTVSSMAQCHLCKQQSGVINCHPVLSLGLRVFTEYEPSIHLLSIEISPSTSMCFPRGQCEQVQDILSSA